MKFWEKLNKIIFIFVFGAACFTMNSDKLSGYFGSQGTPFIFLRFALILIFVAFAVIINRKNLRFVSASEFTIVLVTTFLFIFDYYVTNFSGSLFLYRAWWIAYVLMAQSALFITASLFKSQDYKLFYKRFWYGFTPLYVFTLIICFLRNPFSTVRTTNAVPFQGTFLMLKALINNIHVSFEAPLIFFGNLAIFVPLPFILFNGFGKAKPGVIALVGILTPLFVEGYQYVFSCGDVDVDDLILNWFGFFAGFALQRMIYKKRLAIGNE